MGQEKQNSSHTVMPKKLAQALMEASMQHFDTGGQAQPVFQQSQGLQNQNMGTSNTGFQSNGPGISGESVGSQFLTGNPTAGDYKNPKSPTEYFNQQNNSAGDAINGAGGIMKDAAAAFTSLNNYQANAPTIGQQNFAPQVNRLQNQQAQTYQQQQNLANALLAQSRGQGPNPAQEQLAQNTGQNVAQQAALMAGQRGASSNVGLMARQAAQNGATVQQNAAGQAATLGAQQQLASQQALSGLYGNLANQSLQGESIQQGGQAAQNTAITSGQLGAQQINANISGQNAAALNGTAGGISNALGAGLANALSKGGYVQKFDTGGIAQYSAPQTPNIQLRDWQNQGLQFQAPEGGDKEKPKDDKSTSEASSAQTTPDGSPVKQYEGTHQYLTPMNYDEGGDIQPLMGIEDFGSKSSPSAASAGNVPNAGISAAGPSGGGGGGMLGGLMALLSQGGQVPTNMVQGGPVAGKAKVKGDSPKNDTVPAMVSPGEAVIPRSIMNSPDMEKKAIEFLRHLKNAKGKASYGDVIASRKKA